MMFELQQRRLNYSVEVLFNQPLRQLSILNLTAELGDNVQLS